MLKAPCFQRKPGIFLGTVGGKKAIFSLAFENSFFHPKRRVSAELCLKQGRLASPVERFAHRRHQVLRAVRLVDKAEDAFRAGLGDLFGGIAARQQDRDMRVGLQELPECVPAGQPRHRQVEDHQVNSLALLPIDLQRLGAVRRQEHLVAVPLQDRPTHVADDSLVVHQQDRLRATDRGGSDGRPVAR